MEKIKRLSEYLKNVFILIILWPIAIVLRNTSNAYRHLWLISERGFDARDNGYWFFKYLREKQQNINTCFVIDKTSPDYGKVAQLGNTVAQKSLRHYLMYLSADYLISTHVQPAAPDMIIFYHLRQIGIHPRGKQAFLQHGIIMSKMKRMQYPNLRVDFFASGGKMEYDYLSSEMGFQKGIVQFTGLCRYDNLARGSIHSNEILLMPTWRSSKYPQGEQFYETAFYKRFQSLLNNHNLLKLLEEHDLKLVFYPHIELQKELDKFKSPSERIILAGWRDYDVQTLLMRCRMLITDYSSVNFDVAYQEKPVVYYQFDLEEFRKLHYKEGYFSYENNGFGPVVKTEEELINNLLTYVHNGFHMQEKYHERLDAFFPTRDEKNCERTFQVLSNIGSKK